VYLVRGFILTRVIGGECGSVADDDGIPAVQVCEEIINPGASGQMSGAGELVEGFGQDPVFRPVDPSRAIAGGGALVCPWRQR
jgi:hypothetical protein